MRTQYLQRAFDIVQQCAAKAASPLRDSCPLRDRNVYTAEALRCRKPAAANDQKLQRGSPTRMRMSFPASATLVLELLKGIVMRVRRLNDLAGSSRVSACELE